MNTSHFLRWSAYVLKYRWYLIAAIGALILGMTIDILLPKSVGFVIDTMLNSEVMTKGFVTLPLSTPKPLREAFFVVLAILVALLIFRAICNYACQMLLTLIGEKVHLDIRSKLFEHLNRLPVSYFDQSQTGRIMARITTDADALWYLLNNGTVSIFGNGLLIVAILVMLFFMHAGLALFCLAVIPLLLFIAFLTRKKATLAAHAQREAIGSIYTNLQEKISGIRLIRAYGRRSVEAESFNKELTGLYKCNLNLVSRFAILGVQSDFLTKTASVLILCLGGVIVTNNSLSIGQLVSFYLYAVMMLSPLGVIVGTLTQVVTNAEVAMQRIFELMDIPVATELDGPNLPSPHFAGAVTFKNISFFYRKNEPVLHSLNLSIPAGTTVALVGPSGSGKSTIVNLLCRFYYPQSGEILIDGSEIASFEVESYRSRISYVTQDSIFFSGTIRENLLYGKPDATSDDIITTLKKTHSYDFVMRQPAGLDTQIGERGIMLSGGQKQRLSIARALLRNPSIVILDEPTSALDAESEAIVLEAIEDIFKGRTCFIIAHRFSTIRSADKILVLDKGIIVQEGNHTSLIAENGLYKELYEKQIERKDPISS